jgi:hypothetical protein
MATFQHPDLQAMREILPPEPQETLGAWILRCRNAGILTHEEAELIESLNPTLWNEPYRLPEAAPTT